MSIEKHGTDQQVVSDVENIMDHLGDSKLYVNSIHEDNDDLFFMIKEGITKYLIVVPAENNTAFNGEEVKAGDKLALKCPLDHSNAEALRDRFEFAKAVLIGKNDSYGFGDRLGNAGPAHLRSVKGTGFKPILAQQSIRELERTNRTADEVMDAASFSVFQEGYHDGFGADGDHLKTPADIDRMVKAGYTMFTIDPSAYVVNEVTDLTEEELHARVDDLPWDELKETKGELLNRILNSNVQLRTGYKIKPTEAELLQGMVKYGRVITHTKMMAEYISSTYPDHPSELELSVDETEEPTTLFEHFLVASELYRLGVELTSLAPRFCGDFEKGIDFKGDLDQFKSEYEQHLAIADMFGGYKLSIHSGSDKFTVYKVIGSLNLGAVHVKTAGTSYLEALRALSVCNPELFRKIMSFSIKRFNDDKKTYHISADLSKIEDPASVSDEKLPDYLDDNHARQVLHVAFGSVLSGSLPEAKDFKKELMTSLEENEELYEGFLLRHFEKHLSPFA